MSYDRSRELRPSNCSRNTIQSSGDSTEGEGKTPYIQGLEHWNIALLQQALEAGAYRQGNCALQVDGGMAPPLKE